MALTQQDLVDIHQLVTEVVRENNKYLIEYMHQNFVTKEEFSRLERKVDQLIDMVTRDMVQLRHDLDEVNTYLYLNTGKRAF